MSLFDKAIASAGFGAAKVNTHLDTHKVCKGDQVTGSVSITGGKIEQKASRVSLVLMTYIDSDEDNYENRKSIELSRFDIAQDVQIKPNTAITIPFTIVLPADTPVSFRDNMIWIETSLDIKMAFDPSDKDYIQVLPHLFMKRILDVLQNELKFVLTKHENKYVPHNGSHLPIVQVFEFNPTQHLIQNLDEMKLIFFVNDLRGLEIVLELPRKMSGTQDHIQKAKPVNDNMALVFIPKKEFEKDDKALADLFVNSIRSHLE